ncbi:MAG: hypothetical protein OEY50_01225 [Nitrospinota bacterium]|nr:hypothetical protein [Nitrospinota bacterium]MDH5677540.1 hypothetical protein [Nitrospinota bacterium]MDH5757521.1 hypothetical protein [Nitrospinota bacterium]
MEISREIEQKMIPLKVIWGSITMSVVVAAGFGYYFTSQGVIPVTLEGPVAEMVILAAGVISVFIILGGYKISEMISISGDNDQNAGESIDQRALNILPRYLQRCVARWALFESVGMIGLVLILLAGIEYLKYCMVFFAISIIYLVKTRPTSQELKQLAGRNTGF